MTCKGMHIIHRWLVRVYKEMKEKSEVNIVDTGFQGKGNSKQEECGIEMKEKENAKKGGRMDANIYNRLICFSLLRIKN